MKDILNYEYLIKDNTSGIEKLFLAIMCRRWDAVNYLVCKLNIDWEKLKNVTYKSTDVTIEKCFSKNLQFLKSNKNKVFYKNLCKQLGESFSDLQADKNYSYDSKDFSCGKSVLDVFFDGKQPVLDVKYYKEQVLAANQVMNNNGTMVLDEVGTGKTVAAIYALQKVIQNRMDEIEIDNHFPAAAILIICPYGKREDWHNDIRRQLGRDSIVIDQSDDGEIMKQKAQNPNKPLIYIMGCTNGNSDDYNSALKLSFKQFLPNRNWDLVVIDECHNCFDSYEGITADRVMLLTATPIVISGKYVPGFDKYKDLMSNILEERNKQILGKKINPINTPKPTEEDIFVLNFKEDIFNVEINRQIQFIECARDKKRQSWYWKLRYEKDFFSAMYADQDDMRLSEKMSEHFPDSLEDYSIQENEKLNTLSQIVEGHGDWIDYAAKSIIIFCETQKTVEMIYTRLAYLANDKTMVGKKYSSIGEIRNVTSNPHIILEKLKSHIRTDKQNRSILITTGKSGGTGLNLGEFNTVIHYELPYTSNELEQRFGRIERADDLISSSSENPHNELEHTNNEVVDNTPVVIKNEMIFLVNEPVENQSDFETNRMLYYAVNKVNIACEYMPVRNTVLFHPKFTQRIQQDAFNFFKDVSDYIESQIGKQQIERYIEYKEQKNDIKGYLEEIIQSVEETAIQKINAVPHIKDKINIILKEIKGNLIIEKHQATLRNFLEFMNKVGNETENTEKILNVVLEYYMWLKNTCKYYGVNLLIEQDLKEYNVYVQTKDTNEDPTLPICSEVDAEQTTDHDMSKTEGNKPSSKVFEETLQSLKNKLEQRTLTLEVLCEKVLKCVNQIKINQNANGIFYVNEKEDKLNPLINKSVHNYREGEPV